MYFPGRGAGKTTVPVGAFGVTASVHVVHQQVFSPPLRTVSTNVNTAKKQIIA